MFLQELEGKNLRPNKRAEKRKKVNNLLKWVVSTSSEEKKRKKLPPGGKSKLNFSVSLCRWLLPFPGLNKTKMATISSF